MTNRTTRQSKKRPPQRGYTVILTAKELELIESALNASMQVLRHVPDINTVRSVIWIERMQQLQDKMKRLKR